MPLLFSLHKVKAPTYLKIRSPPDAREWYLRPPSQTPMALPLQLEAWLQQQQEQNASSVTSGGAVAAANHHMPAVERSKGRSAAAWLDFEPRGRSPQFPTLMLMEEQEAATNEQEQEAMHTPSLPVGGDSSSKRARVGGNSISVDGLLPWPDLMDDVRFMNSNQLIQLLRIMREVMQRGADQDLSQSIPQPAGAEAGRIPNPAKTDWRTMWHLLTSGLMLNLESLATNDLVFVVKVRATSTPPDAFGVAQSLSSPSQVFSERSVTAWDSLARMLLIQAHNRIITFVGAREPGITSSDLPLTPYPLRRSQHPLSQREIQGAETPWHSIAAEADGSTDVPAPPLSEPRWSSSCGVAEEQGPASLSAQQMLEVAGSLATLTQELESRIEEYRALEVKDQILKLKEVCERES